MEVDYLMTKNSRGRGDSSEASNKHRVKLNGDIKILAKLSPGPRDNMPRPTKNSTLICVRGD